MLLNIGIPFVLLLLLSVAYNTLSDRKFMAAAQRRKGPNVVGPKGILQPLTDGGKLFGKQVIILKNSNLILFQLAPILIFSISLFL
jgi:NADH-quinone oxidoreductase subunit H